MRLTSTLSPTSLRDIAVPTLAISAEDDRFGTAAAAQHIAAEIPSARVLILANGGHIWIGHEEEVFAEIERFLGAIEPRQAASE
jgi:pimeloyl-ACP methyl ester carboxylesterase